MKVLGFCLRSMCRTCRPAVAYMVLKRRMLPGACVLFTWRLAPPLRGAFCFPILPAGLRAAPLAL